MKKYPSIEQFRNIIRRVKETHDYQGRDESGNPIYQHIGNYPVLKFTGTIKLHGTNAAVVRYNDGRIEYQSIERVLSLEQDNASFMRTMSDKNLDFLFESLIPHSQEYIAVYGEWCGGSIQKGVAINGLEKMFVIFGIMIDDCWIEYPKNIRSEEQGIYNINQFKTYSIDIDFNKPELSQNKLIEMTIEVEDCCPVGSYFGQTGIGEDIVFTCDSNPTLKFKSKGEKHSVSKVKVLNSVDVEELASIGEFVESVVTENRLQQGITYFKENGISSDPKNTGEFIKWVVNDVLKEESDTIASNNIDERKLKNAIVSKSRIWFLNKIPF